MDKFLMEHLVYFLIRVIKLINLLSSKIYNKLTFGLAVIELFNIQYLIILNNVFKITVAMNSKGANVTMM